MTSRLEVGGQVIRLVRPAEPDRLLDDPQVNDWNRHDDYMPYWAYLWPGALLLAEAVGREPWTDLCTGPGPIRALEIGCGVGLAGLSAVARGLHVDFSDYDCSALDFVKRSAEANGFEPSRYSTRHLDWRDLPAETYPVILGSDVLYERRLVPLVVGLLARMLAPGGLALISCPGRTSAESFATTVKSLGLFCAIESVQAHAADDTEIRGRVFRCGWRGSGIESSSEDP